jgi:hypothetical protein
MVAEIHELLQADMDLPLPLLKVEIHEMRGDCEPDHSRQGCFCLVAVSFS